MYTAMRNLIREEGATFNLLFEGSNDKKRVLGSLRRI